LGLAEQKTERAAGVGGGSEQRASGVWNRRPPQALTTKPELVTAPHSAGDPGRLEYDRLGYRRSSQSLAGEQCGCLAGAAPGQGDPAAAVAVVVDAPGVADLLGLKPHARPPRA